MKNLKDILEGILNDIEDTLTNSDNNVEAVKASMIYKTIIDGISSHDPKKQKDSVEMFKRILIDNKTKRSMDYSKAKLSKGYWIQFKKDDETVSEFMMICTIGPNYYVVDIKNYGDKPRYYMILPSDFYHFEYRLYPKSNYFFKVPNVIDALKGISVLNMCDDIRKAVKAVK